MKFYIQLDKGGYVRDCVTMPVENYVEAELDVPLPINFLAGWWKYLGNGKTELDREKRKDETDSSIDAKLMAILEGYYGTI